MLTDFHSIARPVLALSKDLLPKQVDSRHSHRRAQLLYACCGIMSVFTDKGAFVVPPLRAVWLPAGASHEVHYRGHVSLRTLYIDPAASPNLPTQCRVIEVSDFLRALIIEATRLPPEYDMAGRDGSIMSLILTEISSMPMVPLHVPMPTDVRLARICRALFARPADPMTLDEWARLAGISRATMVRLFLRETGMGFAAWRQQVRLLEALSRLNEGSSITRVAFDVGYRSPSTFTAIFRRAFGITPREYSNSGRVLAEAC